MILMRGIWVKGIKCTDCGKCYNTSLSYFETGVCWECGSGYEAKERVVFRDVLVWQPTYNPFTWFPKWIQEERQ